MLRARGDDERLAGFDGKRRLTLDENFELAVHDVADLFTGVSVTTGAAAGGDLDSGYDGFAAGHGNIFPLDDGALDGRVLRGQADGKEESGQKFHIRLCYTISGCMSMDGIFEAMPTIRTARSEDADAIWAVVEPVIRTGETYCLPQSMTREDALAWWLMEGHEVFVAEEDGLVTGTYFLRANQQGGGSHVANCGYMTAEGAAGRGTGRAMCAHSLDEAKRRGFQAMQFNFVVSTNERAVRLWKSFGFEIVGRLPEAFLHPMAGYADAYVMYRRL
jgi:L-amino acid N-acyltransferase YncA